MLRRACAAGQGTMACAAWTGLRQRLVRSGRCAGPPTGRVTGCPGCCPGCCCRACLRARPPAAGDQRDALHGLDAPRLPVQQRGHDGGAHLPATGCKSGRAGSAGQGSRPAAWQRSMGGACGAGSSAAPAPQIAQGAPGAPIPASRASSRVLLMRTSWYARFSLTPKESGRLGRRMPCARGGAARARGALGPPPGPLPPASTRRTPALAATAYACAPARLAALGCACVTARNLLDSWPPPPPRAHLQDAVHSVVHVSLRHLCGVAPHRLERSLVQHVPQLSACRHTGSTGLGGGQHVAESRFRRRAPAPATQRLGGDSAARGRG